ncbi:MAG: hypothetical protein KDD41_11200 [Flavobacteriales bacterium]|nr:hypothetical protein [Flavobacteriales bacterium]
MKKLLTILLIFASVLTYGQTKKEILAKKWKLNKVEEFGQQFDPMDGQKGDWIEFKADGNFTGIIEGNHVEGSWTASSSASLKVDKTNSKTKINWVKVKIVEKGKFAMEYQNGDLITSTLIFVPEE